MSLDAMRWAWKVQDLTPPVKLVLLSYSDRADENWECWPSKKRLAKDTGMAERSVRRCVEVLEAKGLMKDTGRRMGRTKQIKVFCLQGPKARENEHFSRKGDNLSTLPPENPMDKGLGIPKGDNLSGLKNDTPSPLRVTSGARKGDTRGQERVTPCHPEPIIEPSGNQSLEPPGADSARGGGVFLVSVLINGKPWTLMSEKVEEWVKLYSEKFSPNEIHQLVRVAAQHLIDRPDRRREANKMNQFFSGWIGRSKPVSSKPQANGGYQGIPPKETESTWSEKERNAVRERYLARDRKPPKEQPGKEHHYG